MRDVGQRAAIHHAEDPVPSGVDVLFLVTGLALGGAECQVVDLALTLRSRGYVPAVVTLVDNGDVLKRRLVEAGITVRTGAMKRGKPSVAGFMRTIAVIRSLRPRIVHSHMFHANLLARIARLFVEIPVLVCTAHNSREGGFIPMLLYRLTNHLSSLTTNVSELAARELERRGAAPKHSILAVPNGIDTRVYARSAESRESLRRRLNVVDDAFVFLTVGRLTAQKDHAVLLSAWSILCTTSTRVHLYIAGDGELRQELEKLSASLGIAATVHWLGERTDVPCLMNAADAFVLSSAWEGFGLVVAEAMAIGIPVVSTISNGPEEVLGGTGTVVPVGDASALARAMQNVMSLSGTERAELVKRAQTRVAENYSLEIVTSRWLGLYADLGAKIAPKSLQ